MRAFVNLAKARREKFQKFIQEYLDDTVEEDDFETMGEIGVGKPFYMRKLEEVLKF